MRQTRPAICVPAKAWHLVSEHPSHLSNQGPDGKPCGEWRCGPGAQSVVYGIHPGNIQYAIGPNEIRTIDFAELKWPWGPFWETEPANQTEAKPKDRKRQGDRRLEEEKQLPLIEAYYDVGRKEYLVQNVDGEWHSYDLGQFKLQLRDKGYATGKPQEGLVSPAERVVLDIQASRYVHFAGPLAGRTAGFHKENGKRILVTSSPEILTAKDVEWELLKKIIINMIAGKSEPWAEDQWTVFNGWMKVARQALVAGKYQPGQALALAGEIESGKSLLQLIITAALGGRSAKAAFFLQGRTDFNSELFGAEHLVLEDESASTSHQARSELGAHIKNITVNRIHACHAKRRDIVNLCPWWRLSISLNDQPERMLILPRLTDDVRDKIVLLRATRHAMPIIAETADQKAAFWEMIMRELPGYLYWLETHFIIPEEWVSARFGVREFHHPELVRSLDELSPASVLLELIDQLAPWGLADNEWEGTALEDDNQKGLENQSSVNSQYVALLCVMRHNFNTTK